jgi:hypothetical protein
VRSAPWGYTYTWIIDHDASWALRQGRQANQLPPPYGLWRRVDSCLLDALLGWPEIELTGPVANSIEAHAGWANGAWTSNLQRTVDRGQNFGFDPPDSQYEKPYIERLDAVAPAWRFVDVAEMRAQADVAGVEEASAGQYLLASDVPPSGFQSSMPHLMSADGKSAIFPAGCRPPRRHDFANSWFLYVDADVFFHVAAFVGISHWSFYLGRDESCIGLRHRDRFAPGQPGGLPADLFIQRKSRYSFGSHLSLTRNPSPEVTHRVTTALLDAGLLWTRETGSVCEIPERILRQSRYRDAPENRQKVRITKPKTIIVDGGYIGGLFNSTLSIGATLANT